ncbi:MAG: (Fe-S)-binding protein [Chloroflexi bacterium]|nr:(Fe-S)-binding protein [Chloroflexota bacterium]
MLNENLIAAIRESGIAQGQGEVEGRAALLRQLGLRTMERAEYALIASCFLPSMVPEALRALASLLRHYGIDCTLLPKEYCCGHLLYRQALKSKSDEEMKQADVLAGEFLEANLSQARRAGAGKVIAFCAGCDMAYQRFRDEVPEEILWYPTLLERLFRGGRLELKADYYAGCHYFYRKLNQTGPDLEAVSRVLGRIEGLELNELDHQLCCMRPGEMEKLATAIRNRAVITPCGGCADQLQRTLKAKEDCRVVMLPQVVWAAVSGQPL